MPARGISLAAWRPAVQLCSGSRSCRYSALPRRNVAFRESRHVSCLATTLLTPPNNAADVWWLPLTYDEAIQVAPETAAQDAHARHPHQVHRAVSRAFLRHVLSQYTNIHPEALQISRTENGKPFLRESAVKFNLSHADGLVGVAVSQSNVGIDLELQRRRLRNSGNELKLARRYFSEAEMAAIEQETDEDARRMLFIRLWTLKEAYVKAIGRGIGVPPGLSSFSFLLKDGNIDFRPSEKEPGRRGAWRFGLLEPIEGSLAAICVEGSYGAPGVEDTSAVACQRYATASDFLQVG